MSSESFSVSLCPAMTVANDTYKIRVFEESMAQDVIIQSGELEKTEAGSSIRWHSSSKKITSAKHPAIAINSTHTAIVVIERAENLYAELYGVSRSGLIVLSSLKQYDTGIQPSVAIFDGHVGGYQEADDARVVEVHRSETNCKLWYRIGKIKVKQPMGSGDFKERRLKWSRSRELSDRFLESGWPTAIVYQGHLIILGENLKRSERGRLQYLTGKLAADEITGIHEDFLFPQGEFFRPHLSIDQEKGLEIYMQGGRHISFRQPADLGDDGKLILTEALHSIELRERPVIIDQSPAKADMDIYPGPGEVVKVYNACVRYVKDKLHSLIEQEEDDEKIVSLLDVLQRDQRFSDIHCHLDRYKVFNGLFTFKEHYQKSAILFDKLIQTASRLVLEKSCKLKEASVSLEERLSYYQAKLEKKFLNIRSQYILSVLSTPDYWCKRQNASPWPKNLVFEGGGPKGVVFIGALQALDEAHIPLTRFERVAGTSAGAIMALLVSVGYTVQEMEGLLSQLNFYDFLDDHYLRDNLCEAVKKYKQKSFLSVANFFHLYTSSAREVQEYASERLETYHGLFSGETLRQWLEARVVEKLRARFPNEEAAKLITFEDLESLKAVDKNFKTLVVIGTDTCTDPPSPTTFSAITTPRVLIVDAVRISLAIPGIFYPWQAYEKNEEGQRVPARDGRTYMDGGIFRNYPIDIFDERQYVTKSRRKSIEKRHNPETIGLKIINDYSLYEAFLQGPRLPNRAQDQDAQQDFLEFLPAWLYWLLPSASLHLLKSALHFSDEHQLLKAMSAGAQQMARYVENPTSGWGRSIHLSSGEIGLLDFNLTDEQKSQLMASGKMGVHAFLARTQFAESIIELGDSDREEEPPRKRRAIGAEMEVDDAQEGASVSAVGPT